MSIARQFQQVKVAKGTQPKTSYMDDTPVVSGIKAGHLDAQDEYEKKYGHDQSKPKAEIVEALEKSLAAPKEKKKVTVTRKVQAETAGSVWSGAHAMSITVPKTFELSGEAKQVGARIDGAAVDALKSFPGKYADHVERAFIEYALKYGN